MIAFFAATFAVALAVLGMGTTAPYTAVAGASLADRHGRLRCSS